MNKQQLIDQVTAACLRRTKLVVNLDDESKNCPVCGCDHSYMSEWNESAYKLAHIEAITKGKL